MAGAARRDATPGRDARTTTTTDERHEVGRVIARVGVSFAVAAAVRAVAARLRMASSAENPEAGDASDARDARRRRARDDADAPRTPWATPERCIEWSRRRASVSASLRLAGDARSACRRGIRASLASFSRRSCLAPRARGTCARRRERRARDGFVRKGKAYAPRFDILTSCW